MLSRNRKEIRVLAVMEAATVSGPAKNLIRFCRLARQSEEGAAADVSIVTFRRGEGSNQFIDSARAAGIVVHVLRERYRFDLSVVRGLRDVVRQQAPDIVQTHGVKPHFLALLSGLRRRARWIAFHHGYTAEDLKMRLYNQLDRWSLPAADRVVTVCKPFADHLVSLGVNPNCVTVLPNSIEASPPQNHNNSAELRRKLGIEAGESVILSIGRFSREKAMADLVPAAVLLARSNPELRFRLVVVGDGPERHHVEHAAVASGVAGRFLFAGQQRDVNPFFGLADLFVLPSHSEGSPNVILEAMDAGVPIVATAVGGVPETVRHEESALLVRAQDSEALAAAMGRLLCDRELAARLAAAALIAVKQRFSPGEYCRALCAIYDSCLTGTKM